MIGGDFMKDLDQYYSDYSTLKEDHSYFALELRNYIDSLPGKWFFKECFNPDCDGIRFVIELHNGGKESKILYSVKSGSSYIFNENQ